AAPLSPIDGRVTSPHRVSVEGGPAEEFSFYGHILPGCLEKNGYSIMDHNINLLCPSKAGSMFGLGILFRTRPASTSQTRSAGHYVSPLPHLFPPLLMRFPSPHSSIDLYPP
ncbi:hypothetical protein BO83DRAFT_312891, partial [Aspergillus eucalypticola CBS 122712]